MELTTRTIYNSYLAILAGLYLSMFNGPVGLSRNRYWSNIYLNTYKIKEITLHNVAKLKIVAWGPPTDGTIY